MKILVITGMFPDHFNPMSGIFISRSLEKLSALGVQVDVVRLYPKDSFGIQLLKTLLKKQTNANKRAQSINGIGLQLLPIDFGILDRLFQNDRYVNLAVKKIKEHFDLNKYSLIHAHGVYPHGYIAVMLKNMSGLKCLVSAHGSDIHTNPYKSNKVRGKTLYVLESADKVIFNSEGLLKNATDLGYREGNSIIIPIGVDTSIFVPMDKKVVCKKLGIKSDKKYVGYVGNLKRVKGADRLPHIFKAIESEYNNVGFLIVGEGELRDQIEKNAMLKKVDIQFTGKVAPDIVPLWMNMLDVLVMPSRNEGFGSVALEAQACGCQVVGSNVGGIPEAIGNCGVVVDAGFNFEARFANAVVDLLNNPIGKEELRRRALVFDWDIIANSQLSTYKSIL